ncbi:MAG TPA: formyltransferase family protein [Thermoplasmata archaeon]|nr:formyltransferase family protein [Thermoplasmata archaeon]
MRIAVVTMDDPVVVNRFVGSVLRSKRESVVGVAVARGRGQLSARRRRSDPRYAIALAVAAGIGPTLQALRRVLAARRARKAGSAPAGSDLCIDFEARALGIPVVEVESANSPEAMAALASWSPDVVVNQSQDIISAEVLRCARIGFLNRHNSLLPEYRGRLAPFWALYHGERRIGVTIHFLAEGVDEGDIVVQRAIDLRPGEGFAVADARCYEAAPSAMLEALDRVSRGERGRPMPRPLPAPYKVPTIGQAIRFRLGLRPREPRGRSPALDP